MTIPTTPLKFPMQGQPVDAKGNWTQPWFLSLQALYTRVGADSAPSNAQLATAIGGSVSGPATSTDGDVAVFSGTSGLVLKDTSVQLSSLATNAQLALKAPLASPTFTGTVTFSGLASTEASTTAGAGLNIPPGVAPTSPNNGDLWSTSAGFYGRVNGVTVGPFGTGGGSGTTSSFSAHNNGVVQSIPTATFTKLTFSTAVFNNGSNLSGSTWTPPAGQPVLLEGAMCIATAASDLVTAAIYKNGAEYKRGTMIQGVSSSAAVVTVSCIDIPNGTDYYELWGFQSTGSSQNTVGTSTLTYFQGSAIPAGGSGGSGASWGSITGTLSAQTDLYSALRLTRGAGWSGAGSAITTPTDDISITCPVAGVITGVQIITQGGTGSCVIGVYKGAFASLPLTGANSITASDTPTITAGISYSDTTLTGWTTSVAAGDVIAFHLASSSTFTTIEILLTIQA